MIKNNLTYIHPLKLTGKSGEAVFKITDLRTQYIHSMESPKNVQFVPQPSDLEGNADITFSLNMKHDVFRVKHLEKLSKKEFTNHIKANLAGTEKVTVKNIELIRQHRRRFKISNVGNFPAEIQDVTLSNHQKKHNGFTIKKINTEEEGFEILYEPDFRHSKVFETILVKTETSITEFTIEANIPVYLIKFIDQNFRLTEIEEKVGNYYYIIIFFFTVCTLLLMGTELVEYVIYLKQKSLNYNLLSEVRNHIR